MRCGAVSAERVLADAAAIVLAMMPPPSTRAWPSAAS